MSRHPMRYPVQATGPSALSLAASALLHAALIGVTVYYTREPGHYAEGGSTELVRFLVPPDKVPRYKISTERIEWVRIGIPDGWGLSDVDGERAGKELATAPREGDQGADPEIDFRRSKLLDELLGNAFIFSATDVDSTVERSPESGAPLYPPELLDAKVEGQVHTIYVVDSVGRVDSASFRVVFATDPGFTAAVLEAIPYMRFRPAMAGGRPVAQLVEQTFEFRITVRKPKKAALRPSPGGRTLALAPGDNVRSDHAT